MRVSYKKLWKLLIEKGMTKTDLRIKSGISTVTLARLGKSQNVHMKNLVKICVALGCTFNDIVEFIPAEATDA